MSSYNKQKPAIGQGELTLCLNAAEGRLQLVLGRLAAQNGLEILAAQDWSAVAQGAELLTAALQQMLGNLHLEPNRIGRLAVVTGPGSFTGLRLVCATAAALHRTLRAGLAGLEYLPLLAAGLLEARPDLAAGRLDVCPDLAAGTQDVCPDLGSQEIWVLTHARKGLVYAQGFARLAETTLPLNLPGQNQTTAQLFCLRELSELQVLDLTGLRKLLREHSGFLLGSGLSNNYPELAELIAPVQSPLTSDPSRLAPVQSRLASDPSRLASGDLSGSNSCGHGQWLALPGALDQIRPAVFLRAGMLAPLTEHDLQPLYVRPSDAEENLGQIAAGLGLDGDFARQRLTQLLKA